MLKYVLYVTIIVLYIYYTLSTRKILFNILLLNCKKLSIASYRVTIKVSLFFSPFFHFREALYFFPLYFFFLLRSSYLFLTMVSFQLSEQSLFPMFNHYSFFSLSLYILKDIFFASFSLFG
jgi:hypothetical protein